MREGCLCFCEVALLDRFQSSLEMLAGVGVENFQESRIFGVVVGLDQDRARLLVFWLKLEHGLGNERCSLFRNSSVHRMRWAIFQFPYPSMMPRSSRMPLAPRFAVI
jgi:hypothetical protein